MPRAPRRQRRGSYNAMVSALLPLVIGFAALSVDVSWLRLADGQAQDVADAASHAALIELRSSGNTADARLAAERIVDENIVGGTTGTIGEITFGAWERGGAGLDVSSLRPNAVEVEVGRYEDDPVDLNFSRLWGKDSSPVRSRATAATRSLNVVLVMDVTGSFHREIGQARAAAVRFLDILSDTHGREDRVGMTIYTNRYAWAYSEMFFLDDVGRRAAAREAWGQLDVASKPHAGCPNNSTKRDNPAVVVEERYLNWSRGGKKPAMPREYCDEPGTDHHVGVVLGRQLIREIDDPLAYRAMVVLTDGDPNGLEPSPLQGVEGYEQYENARDYHGYQEERWREYQGPVPHSRSQIEDASVAQTAAAWTEEEIHVWTVSFRARSAYLGDMPQGDGRFYYTDNASELTPIFEDIARSLPLMIVE
jgi:hypothetical protein